MKRFKFTVTPKHKDGALDFPTDMLRYDRCYPVTLEDARAINYALCVGWANAYQSEAYLTEDKPFKGTIELQSNDRVPSSARWESQGWLVTNIESFRQ